MQNLLQRESVKIIIESIKKGRSVFILGIIVSVIGSVVSVILPYLAKLEIDQLVEKQGFSFFGVQLSAFDTFIGILVIFFFISFLNQLFIEITNVFLREREEIFRHGTDIFLYQRITKMEIGISFSESFQDILRYVDNKLEDIIKTIVGIPKDILGIIIRLAGIGGILIIFDWKIFCIVTLGGIVSYFIGKMRHSNDMRREYDPKLKAIEYASWSIPSELRRNMAELSRNGAIKSVLATFTKNIYEKQRLVRPYQEKQIFISSLTFFSDTLISVIVKIVVGYLVFQGTLSVGMVTMAVMYTGQLSSVLDDIFRSLFSFKKVKFDLSFFDEFLKISVPAGSQLYQEKTISEISFQGVSFSYPDPENIEKPFYDLMRESLKIMQSSGESPWSVQRAKEDIERFEESHRDKENLPAKVLSEFNFSFVTGKIYGIVGKNGAGKTTLINLISGFFRSYEGSILFNGKDIREWTVESFSNIISVISQVPYTYRAYGDSTIKINLLLGVERVVSDEELYELLSDFGLEKKIRKSSQGLDSEIGKDIEFSGGQNQILSIVRVLLQDRPIIVLDEGTNQLDAENEALVMKYLLKRRSGKIILFITHRMNTIARSDEVLCIEGGNIVAHGTPSELLQQGDNPYARFYRTQILHEDSSV